MIVFISRRPVCMGTEDSFRVGIEEGRFLLFEILEVVLLLSGRVGVGVSSGIFVLLIGCGWIGGEMGNGPASFLVIFKGRAIVAEEDSEDGEVR